MLSIKERQEKLKFLGFYKGAIDGIEGVKTKRAYKDLQNTYFFRAKDKDGKYGNNTEKLLLCAFNVKKYTKNFDIKKDKLYCRCKGKYCTGYPAVIQVDLLKNLQAERDKWGGTSVTSMLRCKTWNKEVGGSSTSYHMKGKAVDFWNKHTLTLAKRKDVINYWFKLNNPHYSYCNGYYKSTSGSGKKVAKGMGVSVHGDIK
ncbi:MAG: peptidoglycan-binding protein [Methanobrevibacter sp.]|nr:peptidoglycan-binding protein [Methanobrevibacter sp.]